MSCLPPNSLGPPLTTLYGSRTSILMVLFSPLAFFRILSLPYPQIVLQITFIRHKGLCDDRPSNSLPGFHIITKRASFQSGVHCCSCSSAFITLNRISGISNILIFMALGGILSGPGALPAFIFSLASRSSSLVNS